MPRGATGLSRIEALFALASAGVLLSSVASWISPAVENPNSGPDYREALEVARAEVEALSSLTPDALARQLPPGERVAVIPGSLLGERQSSGAVSILGRRVPWDGACAGLETSPGHACPGLYRRIERLDGAYRVTIVVAWPDPDGRPGQPLRRVDLQSRLG
jgi:hypothetical protein